MKRFLIVILLFIASMQIHAQSRGAVELYSDGNYQESAGNYYKAIELYKTSLSRNNNYIEPVIGLARAYYFLNEYEEALLYIEKAERLDKNNTEVMNLKARLFLSTGDFNNAEILFNKILEIEENNIDAGFGLAEIDIASGRITRAAERFEEAIAVSPESRKALLSMVLISDRNGDTEKAEYYLTQALQYYSGNPYVRYTAAEHYYNEGNLDEALFHLKTALFLKKDFTEASLLLSRLYMDQQKYNEVISVINNIISENDNEVLLWYMLGRAYENSGDTSKSILCYSRAFNIKPDEDLSRIALENEIIRNTQIDDNVRVKYSNYHVELGRKYEERNMIDKAEYEYRRALLIYPDSYEARLLSAGIYKRIGYDERYISILTELSAIRTDDIDLKDEIEIQKSLMDETLSEKWNINQFTEPKMKNKIAVFYAEDSMNHIQGEQILSEYINYLLTGYENIEITVTGFNGDYAECFRLSRENNADYFIIFDIYETERVVSLQSRVYLADTGGELERLEAVRTGNQMLHEASSAIVEEIHSRLPVYGSIINRKFDQVVINLGHRDGISSGAELMIIKKGMIQRNKSDFSLSFASEDLLGSIKISSSDELVSEGEVSVSQFFDMINPGDYVIPVIPASEDENTSEQQLPVTSDAQLFIPDDLFSSINNIR